VVGELPRARYNGWIRWTQAQDWEDFQVLMIRLSRIGKKKHPFYRVVVTEKTRPRNGRFVEIIGTYDPGKNPSIVQLDQERVKYWLSKGAQPSDTVRSLIRNPKPA
jgi:small subunit ribosomal protein S16